MSTESISEQISSKLMTNAQAAKYCGYSVASWNKARIEGWIGKRHLSPPPYIRINANCVMYEKDVLDKWIVDFIKEKFSSVKKVEVAA